MYFEFTLANLKEVESKLKNRWFTIEDGSTKYYGDLPKSISEGTKKD